MSIDAEDVKKAKVAKPKEFSTLAQATSQAVKENVTVDIGRIFVLPIQLIDRYDNPRNEPEHLFELGYTLFGDPKIEEATETDYVSLVHLALSDDVEHQLQYVELIEEHESPIKRLINPQGKTVYNGAESECKGRLKLQESKAGWKIEEQPGAPQSVLELAEDIKTYGQLDPIEIRKHGNKIAVIDGGRRIAAVLYLHAKSIVLRNDKQEDQLFGEGIPKEYPALVQATEINVSGDDFALACQINLSRKEFTPLQIGRIYHAMLGKINPNTGKNYTMKDAATTLGVEYATFRNREALWREPEYDEDGKKIRGLTDEDRKKVANGQMLLTAASRKALGEKHYSETGAPSPNRKRCLPLSEMQKLFDESTEDLQERRQAIAECMGLNLKQAETESEKRIAEQDRQALAAHDKKSKKKEKAA